MSETYTFLNAAEKVLEQFANHQPMHYQEITKRALEQGWLNTSGQTPAASMNALIAVDIRRIKANGESSRFERISPGCFGLVKWNENNPVQQQISRHNTEIAKALRKRLRKLNPFIFEALIAEALLPAMGFENIELTGRTNDGGIDVRGTLSLDDLVRIKMAVQVKCFKDNVGRPVVQSLRGSLNTHEQGLIITTSDFTTNAKTEANEPNKTPIGLMNGQQLVNLLMKYEIGVERIPSELFNLSELSLEGGEEEK